MFRISTLLFSPSFFSHRFLPFPPMNSLRTSPITNATPNSRSRGGNRDHNSNVIMIGEVPCKLNDDFELKRDQKWIIPPNVPSSYYDSDFKSVSSTKRRSRIDLGLERGIKSSTSSSQLDELSLPNQFGKKNGMLSPRKRRDFGSKSSVVNDNFELFDICSDKRRRKEKFRTSWQVKETSVEAKDDKVLRPGMVLLKHYISLQKQITLVKICQKLGLGPGGFYQPCYENGAKLRLRMMCLGLDWDPQTRKYEKVRAVDGSKPPEIPHICSVLVKKAIKDAHALIKNNDNKNDVEEILPTMSPDICIANFYWTSGRLGLHQDRDESKDSLDKGLPVVSFSLGNSAEFLYGDRRDVDKAEKVVLESGDVLIFGGESRHIFHGVSSIIPKTTPKKLLDYTGLCPGRLNLTFRKY